MDESVRRAVERAIATMRANLGEPLTMDDLARAAMFSKFHFSRIFRQTTGVSPGRFLSAMRLAEAKRLLRSTSTTVTTISHQVGYSSVSTFSTLFSLRVGISPNYYRQFGGVRPAVLAENPRRIDTGTAVVRGSVVQPLGCRSGPVFVGLFPGWISEGRPVSWTVLDEPGPYVLSDVPAGNWQLLAHLIEPEAAMSTANSDAVVDHVDQVGCHGSITTRPDGTARLADILLHPIRAVDPPVLLALWPNTEPAAPMRLAG